MRKWAIWNIVGFVLCVIGAVLLGKTFAETGFHPEAFDTREYVTSTLDVEEDFSSVSVSGNLEDVNVIPSEDGKCHVTVLTEKGVSCICKVEGETLVIRTEDDREWYKSIGFSDKSPAITVALPGDACQDLTIDTNVGDVLISGLIFRTLKVNVTTGDVTLDACDAQEAYLSTVTGDVRGSFLTDKRFFVNTNTGDVDVPDAASGGTCEITTNTGDVSVKISKERGGAE